MKGSNWIPAHVLPEQVDLSSVLLPARQVDTDYLYDLLYSAKEAGMNMLRVTFTPFSLPLLLHRFGAAASTNWTLFTTLQTSWES